MWKKISYFIGGLAVLVGGGVSLLNYFVLPGCDSSKVSDTIRSIFSSQNLELTALNAFTTVSDESARKDCKAHYEIPGETGSLDYSVTWDGWDAQVRIENVVAESTSAPPAEIPAAPEAPAAPALPPG